MVDIEAADGGGRAVVGLLGVEGTPDGGDFLFAPVFAQQASVSERDVLVVGRAGVQGGWRVCPGAVADEAGSNYANAHLMRKRSYNSD